MIKRESKIDSRDGNSPGGTLGSLDLELLNPTLILIILAAVAGVCTLNSLRSFAVGAAQETDAITDNAAESLKRLLSKVDPCPHVGQ